MRSVESFIFVLKPFFNVSDILTITWWRFRPVVIQMLMLPDGFLFVCLQLDLKKAQGTAPEDKGGKLSVLVVQTMYLH